MRKIVKIASIFLIYLATYPLYAPFFKDYVLAAPPPTQPAEATCDSVRQWELTWRPKIIYCQNPLKYDDNNNNIHENRYFVYASKPDSYSYVNLNFGGLPGNIQINTLTDNVAHWIDSTHLSIDNSGAFYFARPIGENKQLSFSSSDPNVIAIPVTNCTEEVILSAILFEEGKFAKQGSKANEDFLNLGGYLIAMVFSMFQADFDGKLPENINLNIAQYIINSGQTNRNGFLLLIGQDDKPQFVPLTGSTEYAGSTYLKWDPSPGALNTMKYYWQEVKLGHYKQIILGETMPPIEERTNLFEQKGIDLHLLPIRGPEDLEQIKSLQGIFDGQDIPILFVTSSSMDAAKNNILYKFFFELNPERIPVQTVSDSGRELVNGFQYQASLTSPDGQTEEYSFFDWDPRDVLLQRPLERLRADITTDGKTFLYSITTDPKIYSLMSVQTANRLGQNYLNWLYDDWLDFKKTDLTDAYKKELATNALNYDIPAYRNIIEAMDEGSTKDNFRLMVNQHEQALQAAIDYFDGKKSILDAENAYLESMGKAEELLAKEGIIEIGKANEIGASQGQLPIEEAVKYADDAAKIAAESSNEVFESLESKFTKTSGETVGAPDEFSNAKTIANNEVDNLISSEALTFTFIFSVSSSIAPHLVEYGNNYHNYFVTAVGYGIQITGTGLFIYWVIQTAIEGVKIALEGTAAEFASWFTSIAGGFIMGYFIGRIVGIIVDIIYCNYFAPPNSPTCMRCTTDPAYSKSMFKLEKNTMRIGENLHYVFYGRKYCPELTGGSAFNGIQLFARDDPNNLNKVWSVGKVYGGTYFNDSCTTLDGTCFDCVVNVQDPINAGVIASPGKYYSYVCSGTGGLFFCTDVQEFYLCPSNYVDDLSDGKCVLCNWSTHKEADAIGTGIDSYCENACGADQFCDEKDPSSQRGYTDDYSPNCIGAGPVSASQMRACSGSNGNCACSVPFDSYIEKVSVNRIGYNDTTVDEDKNIEVLVTIDNTGSLSQGAGAWFVGVEFWKVEDYNNPSNTRSQRVDTYFTTNSHGNNQGISGADCSLITDLSQTNGYFNPGKTVTVKCWVPASYYGPTSGNQRIMFWVHERDLGQDAANDGNGGNTWWSDALSRSFRPGIDDPINGGPAPVRVYIRRPTTTTTIPTAEKSCLLSGGDWTDTRASQTACKNYCSRLRYLISGVVGSGSKTCAGAYCSYISDFSTCSQATIGNDGHCQCNSQQTCFCSLPAYGYFRSWSWRAPIPLGLANTTAITVLIAIAVLAIIFIGFKFFVKKK